MQPKNNRHGSDLDVKALSATFLQFGFDLCLYANLKKAELIEKIDFLAKCEQLKCYASLVVCLLSHGGLGTVAGVDNEYINVLELQWAFNNTDCLHLADKPKIFIIQACQGNSGQRMISVGYSAPRLQNISLPSPGE